MAKRPEAGRTKTRLAATTSLGADAVTQIAWAFIECTLERLGRIAGDLVLGTDPPGSGPSILGRLGLEGVRTVDQGRGDLGERIQTVWARAAGAGPAAFFGADTPDLPLDLVASIAPALERADVVLGPTADGGYWTIAARQPVPALLARVDWGTEHVYDQTLARAREAGLSVATLGEWDDVDTGTDLDALRDRLAAADGDEPLRRLAETLRSVEQP